MPFAIEQCLLHHFLITTADKRVANKTFLPGYPAVKGYKAYAIYMTFTLEEEPAAAPPPQEPAATPPPQEPAATPPPQEPATPPPPQTDPPKAKKQAKKRTPQQKKLATEKTAEN